jgi:DNA-binding transcriptional LysR family regulator
MALGGTDLNLLLPLKVLLEEGNVTRAGQRLELSQPAMSAALARLRLWFDDELLVRAGRDYELTPLARELLPEVQHAVRLLARALEL